MRTNAIEVGVEQAVADLACRYTLGFTIDAGERGRIRDVVVRVKRDGLRAIHPSRWTARSPEDRRRSALTAAWHAPGAFDRGVVRAHLFPVAPEGRKRWTTALAVRFPVSLAPGAESVATREFGVTVSTDSHTVHRVSRSVTVRATAVEERDEPTIVFVDSLSLAPGRYDVRAVVLDPDAATPWGTASVVEIPEIPRREVFVVEPLLGLPLSADVAVVFGGETAADDRGGDGLVPMLIGRLDAPVDVSALTRACRVGRARDEDTIEVERLVRRNGEVIGSLPVVDPDFDQGGRVRCATLVDVIPAATLGAGRYELEVGVVGAPADERVSARFSIAADR